ncbi:MAG: NAD(P)H-dependent oxidoreductase [Candidatus Thermoplasmatota archaeon]
MNVLVMYYSRSGNTKKLALEIEKGIKKVDDVDVVLKEVSDVTKQDFLNSDGVIVGSPVYFGSMANPVKKVLDDFVGIRKDMEGKVGAAFVTSGGPFGGNETTLISILEALLIYGMIIVGDPMDATGHYGVACAGSPDGKTRSNAQKLGERVGKLVKKLRK